MALRFEAIRSHLGGDLRVGPSGFVQLAGRDRGDLRQHWLRAPTIGDNVKVINRATGLVIDAQGPGLGDGRLLQHYVDHGGENQRWQFTPSSEPERFIVRANGTSKVWDIPHGLAMPGEIVQTFEANGHDHQLWRLRDRELLDSYTIHPVVNDQLRLDAANHAHNDGDPISQQGETWGFNQMWVVLPHSGPNRIIAVHSRKVLTYPAAAAASNRVATVQQQEWSGGKEQLWNIEVVGSSGGNDVVEFRSDANGFALDVPHSHTGHTILQAYPHHGGTNQRWIVKPVG